MIYKTDIDLKETFYKMNTALSSVEVKGDSVEIIYSARLTLKELFDKVLVIEEKKEDVETDLLEEAEVIEEK